MDIISLLDPKTVWDADANCLSVGGKKISSRSDRDRRRTTLCKDQKRWVTSSSGKEEEISRNTDEVIQEQLTIVQLGPMPADSFQASGATLVNKVSQHRESGDKE